MAVEKVIKEEKIFQNVSFSLLSVLFLLFLSASAGFVFGIGINSFSIILSVALGMTAPFLLRTSDAEEFLLGIVIIFSFIALSLQISEAVTDVSYDGRWYHQPAALFLKKGWNPVYVRASDFLAAHWTIKDISSLSFIESYPKASEIISACIFYLTDNIQTGKAVNLLASAALFFYLLYIFTAYFPDLIGIFRFLFSFVAIINPVVLAQVHTGYVDGPVYIYFMFVLFSIIELEKTNRQSKAGLFVFIMSLTLLAGTKMTGGLYAAEIAFFYLLYLQRHEQHIEKLKRICLIIVTLIFITNINPYLTNLCHGKHLFYPVFGNENNIVTHNVPKYFLNKSIPYKFFMSLFTTVKNSSVELPHTNSPIKIKVPFTYSSDEKRELGFPDLRLSGFGIWESGILLLSLLLLPFTRKNSKTDRSLYHLIMLILVTSVLTNPYNWWARLIPQFYAIPLFIVLFFTIKRSSVYRYSFAGVLLFLMISNSLFTYMEVSYRITLLSETIAIEYTTLSDSSGRLIESKTIQALMLTEK